MSNSAEQLTLPEGLPNDYEVCACGFDHEYDALTPATCKAILDYHTEAGDLRNDLDS